MTNDKMILVGKIVAPQGLRGEFRVQTYSEKPTDFKNFVVLSDKFSSDTFHFVRQLNPKSDIIIARIDGINDRNSVELLRGTDLYISRDSLPKLSEDEYYQSDLIGFKIIQNNHIIGIVDGFQNFGAGDIIESNNGNMFSFIGAKIDLTNKTITVK